MDGPPPPGGRTLIARKPIRVMIVDDSAIVRQVVIVALNLKLLWDFSTGGF